MREERLRRRVPREDPRPHAPDRDVAELKATALLAKARILKPPVDVEECARVAGIAMVTNADLGVGQGDDSTSAVLMKRADVIVIVVNSRQVKARQRFSIAHEIGHWALERAPATHDLRPIAASGRRYDELERVCDYFAVCLLMPRNWIRDRVGSGMTIAELEKAFQVSTPALVGRLRELDYYSRRGMP